MIKLFDPNFSEEEERSINEVLHSRFWASGAGTGKVAEFEEEFNAYIGSNCCVALNSGTAALHLAILQLDVKDKEVLVPSLTFVSTIHAILYGGGKPLFVDVEEKTLCIDVADLERKISKKTALIIPVHLGGIPCDLNEITRIAKDLKIPIVEDAAHACGSNYDGRKIGAHSDLVCFSFHPVKNLSMPTGGAITLNGDKVDERKNIMKSLRWCGIDERNGIFYDVPRIGWNYYMNEFSAAVGLVQLKKLDLMNARRKHIAKMYHENISADHKMPFSDCCCYHLYWIRVKNRLEFIKQLNASGIEVGVHYKPVHMMKMYNSNLTLEKTEKIWPEIVSLPMHCNLTDTEVEYIIKKVNQFSR